ncbi:Protein of unknown function, partial [Gryllus bimaculatus]
WRGRVECTLC